MGLFNAAQLLLNVMKTEGFSAVPPINSTLCCNSSVYLKFIV